MPGLQKGWGWRWVGRGPSNTLQHTEVAMPPWCLFPREPLGPAEGAGSQGRTPANTPQNTEVAMSLWYLFPRDPGYTYIPVSPDFQLGQTCGGGRLCISQGRWVMRRLSHFDKAFGI